MTWTEPVAEPAELFSVHFPKTTEAVEFIATLAVQLAQVYIKTKFLRPVIAIENLTLRSKIDESKEIVLNNLNFDMVLDDQKRGEECEYEDVQRLRKLLLQLLNGIALSKAGKLPEELTELSKERPDTVDVWQHGENEDQDRTVAALWEILGSDSRKDLHGFAKELADCLPNFDLKKNAQSTQADAQPQNEIIPVIPGVVTDVRKTELPDPQLSSHLEIRLFSGPLEFVFIQPLKDDLTLLGDERLTVTEETVRTLKKEKLDSDKPYYEARRSLQQRRIYIQRHLSQSTGTHFYTITDMDQAFPDNRTLLNGLPLSPLFSALLAPSSTVEVGNGYRIKLKTSEPSRPSGWVAAQERGLSALQFLAEPSIIDPNLKSLPLLLKISNLTNRVERLTIAIDGAPPDWPVSRPVTIHLFDEENTQETFSLQVPRDRLAGEYKLTLRLVSDNVGAQVAAKELRLIVPQQHEFSGYLQPELLRIGEFGKLRIRNDGNYHRSFIVTWQDRANELNFKPKETTVSLPPFSDGDIDYSVLLGRWRRPLIGNQKRHEIGATVTPQTQHHGAPQTYRAQVVSRAWVPLWASMAVGILLMGGLLLYSLLFTPNFTQRSIKSNGVEVQTAIAGEELTLEWQSVNACAYALFQNGVLNLPAGRDRSINSASIPNVNAGDKIDLQLPRMHFSANAQLDRGGCCCCATGPHCPGNLHIFLEHTECGDLGRRHRRRRQFRRNRKSTDSAAGSDR